MLFQIYHEAKISKIFYITSYDVAKIIESTFALSKISRMQPADPILMDLIAKRLNEIRKSHGDTKEYVLHQTGLGISDYERKAKFPTLTSIAKFCKLYDLSLDEFFKGMDYPKNK